VSNRTLLFILIGVVVVAIAVGLTLYFTRGAHIRLEGAIQNYRTLAVEQNASLAFVDFRLSNPADYPFVVKKVTLTLITRDGERLEGTNIAEIDAQRIFDFYKILGQKYNPTLLVRDKISPHSTWDRMLGARFDAPESKIQNPKQIRLRIDDVDGAWSEIVK